MKNVFVFIVCVLLLCSCSDGLEKQAKKHLNNYIEEFAKNPDSFKTKQMKTVYNTDSLCVIEFVGKGQNGFGGYTSSHYEYIYLRTKLKDGSYRFSEALINLDEGRKSFSEQIQEYQTKDNMTKEKYIRICAESKCIFDGRVVKDM